MRQHPDLSDDSGGRKNYSFLGTDAEEKQIWASGSMLYNCLLAYLQYKYTGKGLTLSDNRIKIDCASSDHGRVQKTNKIWIGK